MEPYRGLGHYIPYYLFKLSWDRVGFDWGELLNYYNSNNINDNNFKECFVSFLYKIDEMCPMFD